MVSGVCAVSVILRKAVQQKRLPTITLKMFKNCQLHQKSLPTIPKTSANHTKNVCQLYQKRPPTITNYNNYNRKEFKIIPNTCRNDPEILSPEILSLLVGQPSVRRDQRKRNQNWQN
jgi:hypothetical protein